MQHETPTIVELIEVIHVQSKRGEGTDLNPVRVIDQFWDKQGNLLAERDPYIDKLGN